MVTKKTFSGKTLDEALEGATRAYKKRREELNYRVLMEKKSLFGLAKMVTIEVTEDHVPSSIRVLLNRLIMGMKVNLSYDIDVNDRGIVVELNGNDVGLLLHRNGELLDAFQTLLIQTAKINGFEGRVIVDADHFRGRLKGKLQRKARQAAGKVKQSGRSFKMDSLPPHLRKIVHLTLSDSKDVTTHSEGEGYMKQVVITPKRR